MLARSAVAWAPLEIDETSLPLPPRLQELPTGSFVGRAVERERLSELLAEAGAGNRRVVLLPGEPGIGKTRLATHAALAARSEAAVVLYGRAEEELAIPYGPWIEAIRHYVDCASESTLRAYVEALERELPAPGGLPCRSHYRVATSALGRATWVTAGP